MFRISTSKILVAASALLLCAGIAQAQTLPASPLTASPTSVSIGFALPSTAGSAQTTSLTVASGTVPFVIDPTTVPFWLGATAAASSVTSGTPVTVSFQATAAAGSLSAGAYFANVGFAVNGYKELIVQVSLTVTGTASSLSVSDGSTQLTSGGTVNIPWTYGAAPPTLALTLMSSNDPITFSSASAVTSNGPENWIQLVNPNGIAYNYGTTLNVNFAQDALTNATVGSTMGGSITITYGSSTFVVKISIAVGQPAAAVSSIFPQEIAPLASGPLTVVVNGTGLGGASQGFSVATTVSLTYGPGGSTTATLGAGKLSAGSVSYVNPNTMVLTIPVQDGSGTPVPILTTAGQNVTLSITNTGINSSPVTVTLYVTSNPIVYSIADAAALEEPTPGSTPTVAPYELISIFGSNFCPSCTSPVVAPVASGRYPTSLTAPASGSDAVTVTFYKGNSTTLSSLTPIADAYIVFASNTQINALVPSTLVAADEPIQVVVGYGTSSSPLVSNGNVAYLVNAGLANPGVFTTSSNGQGQGAILNQDGSVNSSSNKEAPGSTISIYASGLGVPNSTAADTAGKSAAKFPTSCISVASYVTAAALANPATADGAVLVSSDIETNMLPPCFATANQVSVTINGAAATVTYAGWVSGSVTGLYQINATIPKTAPSGNLPVVVSVTNGKVVNTSQAGVTVAVN